jgi:very-short-patch-repair endonuclease
MAAVLACGAGAVLSHRSAAELWGMLAPRRGPVHVTIPSAAGRKRRPWIRLHRCRQLPEGATTRQRGIPVTVPSRTLADLRLVTEVDEWRRAIREAEYLELPVGDLGPLRGEPTRSALERAFLRLCRRHRLPRPEVNVEVGGFEVDFLWGEEELVVELDGYRSHGTRSAFESDRARDAKLTVLGHEVLRFTARQIKAEPGRVAATVRAVLSARRHRGLDRPS